MLAGLANHFSVKRGSLKKEVILHKNPKWKSAQFRVGVLQPPLGIGFLMVLRIFSFLWSRNWNTRQNYKCFPIHCSDICEELVGVFYAALFSAVLCYLLDPCRETGKKIMRKRRPRPRVGFLLQRTCAEKTVRHIEVCRSWKQYFPHLYQGSDGGKEICLNLQRK